MKKVIQKGNIKITIEVKLKARIERSPDGEVLHQITSYIDDLGFFKSWYATTDALERKILAIEKDAIDFVEARTDTDSKEYEILEKLGFQMVE